MFQLTFNTKATTSDSGVAVGESGMTREVVEGLERKEQRGGKGS